MTTHILLIDDDSDIANGTSLRLRAEGFSTCSTCDGVAGIEIAVAEQPDVILLDVRMPGKSGLDVLADLKRLPRTQHIPVVMLSASPGDRRASLDRGATFFVTKPYERAELVSAIRAAIGLHPAQHKSVHPIPESDHSLQT